MKLCWQYFYKTYIVVSSELYVGWYMVMHYHDIDTQQVQLTNNMWLKTRTSSTLQANLKLYYPIKILHLVELKLNW
jgi:hypothetical protein